MRRIQKYPLTPASLSTIPGMTSFPFSQSPGVIDTPSARKMLASWPLTRVSDSHFAPLFAHAELLQVVGDIEFHKFADIQYPLFTKRSSFELSFPWASCPFDGFIILQIIFFCSNNVYRNNRVIRVEYYLCGILYTTARYDIPLLLVEPQPLDTK